MREKPNDADFYAWDRFEEWANEEGVGDHPDDWSPWWECWKMAYIAAVNANA